MPKPPSGPHNHALTDIDGLDTALTELDARLSDLEQRVVVLENVEPPPEPPPDPEPPPPPDPPVDVEIPLGADWQDIINANPEGTVFLVRAGVHNNQTIDPKNGQEFWGEPGAVMTGNNTTQYAVKAGGRKASNVTFRGIEVRNYAPGYQNGMLAISTGGGWTIADCEIHESTHLGLVFNGPGNRVINCHIHHNRQSNLKGFGDGSLVEGCEIAYGNYLGEFPSGGEGGGTKFLKTTDLILRGNWVHHNYNGLWCDFDNDRPVYEDNLVEDNKDNGIFQEYGYSAVIRNNTVRRNGRGIRLVNHTGGLVTGNDVSESSSWIWMVQRDSGFDNLSGRFGRFVLKDNTVTANRVTLTGGDRHGLRNNHTTVDAFAANNQFTDNTYVNAGAPAKPFFWKDNTTYSWADWQAFGNDVNGSFS